MAIYSNGLKRNEAKYLLNMAIYLALSILGFDISDYRLGLDNLGKLLPASYLLIPNCLYIVRV